MAITFAHADEYLKLILSEEHDSETEAAFPQTVRFRAIQEAAVAIAGLRPEQFAVRIEIAYDATTDSYILPSTHDMLIEVIGLKFDGRIHSLRPSTEAERIGDSPCWRSDQSTEKNPQYFVWSPGAPRVVYVDGYKPSAKLVVNASLLSAIEVDGNPAEIPLPYSFLPQLIDFALSRIYMRPDTGAGDSALALSRFRQMVGDKAGVDNARNPLMLADLKSKEPRR